MHQSSINLSFFFLMYNCIRSCLLILITFKTCRYSITKAFCVAFVLTFFSMFDVPVFWPILLFYWLVLFTLSMKRQILHMIKYKYVPFTFGKQVISKLPTVEVLPSLVSSLTSGLIYLSVTLPRNRPLPMMTVVFLATE